MSRFGDGSHNRCSIMDPKPLLERVVFSLKSPFLRGVERYVLGLQCHQSGCNFWLEWFIRINGTEGTYQRSRFGDGGPDRCSMGPKRSLLGRVVFSTKSTFLRGLGGTFLASNVTKVIVISDWNGSYGSMGSKGHVRCQDLVMGVLTGAPWVKKDRLGGSFLA